MGIIQDEWASDAGEILEEIPKAVTVQRGNGAPVSFNVLMTEPLVQQDLETGGFLDSAAFDVKFLKADCVAQPGVVIYGNLVTFNAKQYRIVAINDRPPSAWIIARIQTKVGPAT